MDTKEVRMPGFTVYSNVGVQGTSCDRTELPFPSISIRGTILNALYLTCSFFDSYCL